MTWLGLATSSFAIEYCGCYHNTLNGGGGEGNGSGDVGGAEMTGLCLTLYDSMHCSPTGSSVHGIFQAGALEWGVIAFSEF